MERIYVTVRARPLSPEESKTITWRISGNSISLANQSTKFEFDRIFGEDRKTAEVYEARTKEIVASAVRGFNGTVFAYGQTSSGKTHTMRGSVAEPGIIPLAVHDLFKSIEEDVDREFLVRMSYMEIYNEEINDLLAPEHRKLQIHESIERGIYVAGLREEIVASPEQVIDLMEFGECHRHIGETNMNLYSSRSHTIFRMIVESRENIQDDNTDNSCDAVRVSVLNLVDLAGSERATKTGAEGIRLKEGSHINKSLLTLGTVIKKLSEGAESQGGHVPYRDSKLTRILQPALGGNSNTAIICNITLAQVHTDETKSSLQFASRALRVTNCAFVNEILTDAALLRRQRKEIEELRAKLLSSNSEHFEEEILNLRNTLLQSELEKEMIALELEEEKKAKAQRERRLLEQAKKIANLSSLVLCSERDEKIIYPSKNRRRETWGPGCFPLKSMSEVFPPDQPTDSGESRRDNRDVDLPPPFEELKQEVSLAMDGTDSDICILDNFENKDQQDDFPLLDAQALCRVTSRKKMHLQSAGSLRRKTEDLEFEVLSNMSAELDCTPIRTISTSSLCHFSGGASCVSKSLSTRESEAILVIKQLQDKIKSLEMEKTFIQRNLDNVVELATQQNASFREKYEEEVNVNSSIKLSMEIQALALQVDDSRSAVDNTVAIVDDLFQNFAMLSKLLLELKSFASQDMVQLQSIIKGHVEIGSWMRKRTNELELEKSLLNNQSVDLQKEIQELKLKLDSLENALAEQALQTDLEKDGLLCQLLSLQKEVTSLSSNSLAREKDSLRKELDKTRTKLKDTESKLKNTIQDKIKLESEKTQAEREIKHLHSQRAILERDILKRDSLIGKRRESKSFDHSKAKGFVGVPGQTLQEEYHKLEVHAFEMEAEIASLNETLINTTQEMEDAFARNGILDSELEDITNKLNLSDSEIQFLKEELTRMTQRLEESVSFSEKLEVSLSLLSREKEEMAMQLTDALLEVEAEKSTWLAKEKAFTDTNDRLKISNDEIARLSIDLLQLRHELESCGEQCTVLREKLTLSEQIAEREKECSTSKSLEIGQIRNELKQYVVCNIEYEDLKSKFEVLLSERHHACEEMKQLQGQLSILKHEIDILSGPVKEMDTESDMSNDYQNLKGQLLIMAREREDLLSKNRELAEADTPKKTYDDMLSKARIDVEEMARTISGMVVKMHNEALDSNKEKAKLRMRLHSTQAKLDAFRGRYEKAMNEMELMNTNFEKASAKLKKQLASYGIEILNLKKELAFKD